MRRRLLSYIIRIYMKEIKNWPTEERVGSSSESKIVVSITGKELNSKYVVCYILDTLVVDIVSLLHLIIQKDFTEPYVKITLLAKTLAIERFLQVD